MQMMFPYEATEQNDVFLIPCPVTFNIYLGMNNQGKQVKNLHIQHICHRVAAGDFFNYVWLSRKVINHKLTTMIEKTFLSQTHLSLSCLPLFLVSSLLHIVCCMTSRSLIKRWYPSIRNVEDKISIGSLPHYPSLEIVLVFFRCSHSEICNCKHKLLLNNIYPSNFG